MGCLRLLKLVVNTTSKRKTTTLSTRWSVTTTSFFACLFAIGFRIIKKSRYRKLVTVTYFTMWRLVSIENCWVVCGMSSKNGETGYSWEGGKVIYEKISYERRQFKFRWLIFIWYSTAVSSGTNWLGQAIMDKRLLSKVASLGKWQTKIWYQRSW